jgi:hypothetical protein
MCIWGGLGIREMGEMSICVSIVLIEVARPWILLNSMLATPGLLPKMLSV